MKSSFQVLIYAIWLYFGQICGFYHTRAISSYECTTRRMVVGDILKSIGFSNDKAKIEFLPSNIVIEALPGKALSEIAANAGVDIKYKCKKGECGTCEVKISNKWVKACQLVIPVVPKGETLQITVKPAVPVPAKKPATFFSPASFVEGVVNNAAGVVGFVTVAASKADDEFEARMKREAELAAKVAAAKAAKALREK